MKTELFRKNKCLLSREGQHFHNRMLQLTVFRKPFTVLLLPLAALLLFAACKKDANIPIQQHDTEYTFEIGYYEQLENIA
jgi:hypothetical protein